MLALVAMTKDPTPKPDAWGALGSASSVVSYKKTAGLSCQTGADRFTTF
jgi:hypothetical protein